MERATTNFWQVAGGVHGIRYIRLIYRANENRLQERRFWDVKLDRVSRNFLRNSLSR